MHLQIIEVFLKMGFVFQEKREMVSCSLVTLKYR